MHVTNFAGRITRRLATRLKNSAVFSSYKMPPTVKANDHIIEPTGKATLHFFKAEIQF